MGLLSRVFRFFFPVRLNNPRKVTRYVLAHFDEMAPDDYKRMESFLLKQRSTEQHLVYALRIASVLPQIKSLKTLASRWQVAHMNDRGVGWGFAKDSPNYHAVEAFLTQRFLDKADELLSPPRKIKIEHPTDITTEFVPRLDGLEELVKARMGI